MNISSWLTLISSCEFAYFFQVRSVIIAAEFKVVLHSSCIGKWRKNLAKACNYWLIIISLRFGWLLLLVFWYFLVFGVYFGRVFVLFWVFCSCWACFHCFCLLVCLFFKIQSCHDIEYCCGIQRQY